MQNQPGSQYYLPLKSSSLSAFGLPLRKLKQQRWRTKEITTASTKREKKCSTFRKRYTKRANALKSCVQTIVSSTSRCGVKRGAFLQDMVTNGYLELELLGGWVIHQRRITLLLRQRDITLNFFFHGQFPFLWLVFDFLFITSSVPLETEKIKPKSRLKRIIRHLKYVSVYWHLIIYLKTTS